MPELPEVETTLQGILPFVSNKKVKAFKVFNSKLRYLVPDSLTHSLPGLYVASVVRRAKYLILNLSNSSTHQADTQGHLIFHLGMSGSLRIAETSDERKKHDHILMQFDKTRYELRFHDPRRFGLCLFFDSLDHCHLLNHLGPEPLSRSFSTQYLKEIIASRTLPVKTFIMDGRVVVGVGNIYANEALFMAGILPNRPVRLLNDDEIKKLVRAIKKVIKKAITQGGTTLRDFVNADGKPGYFKQSLYVYGKENQPCQTCGHLIVQTRMTNRSTFYCPICQK